MGAPLTLIVVRGDEGDIHDQWSLHRCFELYPDAQFLVVGNPSIVSDAARQKYGVECVNTIEEATSKATGRIIITPSDAAIYLTRENLGYGNSDLPATHGVIVTVDRPGIGEYLDRLLTSYGRPVTFMAGPSGEGAYLDKYRGKPNYAVVEQNPLISMPKKIAVNFNFFRTFSRFSECDRLMVMENDIYFTANWEEKLADILNNVPFEKYACTLYRPGKIIGARKNRWVGVPRDEFSCSQCVYYHGVDLGELSRFLFVNGVERYIDGADVLTGKYLEKAGVPLITTVPSLVQHEGHVSCANTAAFHFSETFLP